MSRLIKNLFDSRCSFYLNPEYLKHIFDNNLQYDVLWISLAEISNPQFTR